MQLDRQGTGHDSLLCHTRHLSKGQGAVFRTKQSFDLFPASCDRSHYAPIKSPCHHHVTPKLVCALQDVAYGGVFCGISKSDDAEARSDNAEVLRLPLRLTEVEAIVTEYTCPVCCSNDCAFDQLSVWSWTDRLSDSLLG